MGGILIGRTREVAILEDAMRTAALGVRATVMITGEAGIGKSSLLDELAVRITGAGGQAVWGRTWEVGLTPAFWPWTQVLAALADPEDPAPALVGLDDRSDASSRLSRFDAVGEFLARRAAVRPLGILLDDMHAADPSSMLLLEYISRHVRSARFLIAFTARDGEATHDNELALGRIRRDARRIVVGRLDAAEVAMLVGDRADAQHIYALSDGNPLFVEELLACIEAHGDVAKLAQVAGVRAVIRDRVARLPDETARALEVAALIGRDVHRGVLADVLDIAPAELDRRLAPALRLAVMTRAGARFRFSHALVAESLAEELAGAADLHVRVADAIERHDDEGSAAAIAHHRLAASALDPAGAALATEHAARIALAQLAFEDAAALLERALGVLGGDERRRAGLVCLRAEALQHAGEHERARRLCDHAGEHARRAGDGVLLARIALARGIEFRFGATDRVLVDELREALALMPPGDSALRARCLARLAAAEQPAPDPRIPIADALAAIAMARRVGDRRMQLDVIHVAIAALIDYVPPRTLDDLLREVFTLATGRGDRMIELHNRLRHCFVTLDLGDRDGYDAAVAAHAELAISLGVARWAWPVKLVAAMTALFEGRFEDARSAADEAEVAGAGDPQLERTLAYHRWAAAVTQTGPSAVLARRAADLFAFARPALMLAAACDSGDLAALPERLAVVEPTIAGDNLIASATVDAIALCGDIDRARALYSQLAPEHGRIWVASMTGFTLHEFTDRVLLVLAALVGDWDRIDAYGESASVAARRIGARPWLARIRADWATALDRRGRPGDHERADELWQAALATADQLAMPGLRQRCRAARPDANIIAPLAVAAEPEPISIAREGDLWLARGLGYTTRVRDSRGIQMLARLVGEPGRELHALDLAGEGDGADTGDAGEALDVKAKAAYRRRLADLTEQLEEAEARGDAIRADRARGEIEALAAELKRAVGLGGRDRKIGAATERARSNVQRRLSHAIQQISAGAPPLGEHLQRSLRTGTFCVYEP